MEGLRLYFANQLVVTEHTWACEERKRFCNRVSRRGRHFKKPWYEFHAAQLLEWIADEKRNAVNSKNVVFRYLRSQAFSGQLGRLVEQYYWRFRFEKDCR